jgi:hypothetical protein
MPAASRMGFESAFRIASISVSRIRDIPCWAWAATGVTAKLIARAKRPISRRSAFRPNAEFRGGTSGEEAMHTLLLAPPLEEKA